MKRIYTKMFLSIALSLIVGLSAYAQNQWDLHSKSQKSRSEKPAQTTETGEIIIGHCTVYDEIWPSDGLSLQYDARVGVGAVFPREMIEKYKGGIITAMYVGWDDEFTTSEYECFVRNNSFNASNHTSGSATVGFGWNRVELTPTPIIDADCLCVGFYTDVKKDVCSIPKLYPSGVANSVYLFSGETDTDGNEMWYDMHLVEGMGKMPIMLVITDRNGKFADLVEVTEFRANTIVWRDDVHNAKFTIKNVGSNAIETLKLSSMINGDVMGDEDLVTLDEPIQPSDWVSVTLPIYCLGSGIHDIAITEVNGNKPKQTDTIQFEMIGVPWDTEGKYTHKPVLEFFCSEESYMYPKYWTELFWPGFRQFEKQYTVVMPHLDDKYMTGDNDALTQMLTLLDNDSMKVMVPSFTINRQDNLEYSVPDKGTIFHLGIPFSYPDEPEKQEVINSMYRGVASRPTFASVNISSQFTDDLSTVNIEVSGNVEENVMPEGEPLFLTVYLMERNVSSYDQLFWDDKEGVDKEPQEFIHKNIIRDILSDFWGNELAQTGGAYNQSFTVELDPEWNKSNLYVVAFLNRGVENPEMSRNIINSAEGAISWPNAVYGVEQDSKVAITTLDGTIYINGNAEGVEVYNLAGARLANTSLNDGIYLVKKGDVVAKVFVK